MLMQLSQLSNGLPEIEVYLMENSDLQHSQPDKRSSTQDSLSHLSKNEVTKEIASLLGYK